MAPSCSDPRQIKALLTSRQNEELIRLIGEILLIMREQVKEGFESSLDISSAGNSAAVGEQHMVGGSATKPLDQDQQNQLQKKHDGDLSVRRLRALRAAALKYFDGWQSSVTSLVRDTMKSPEQPNAVPKTNGKPSEHVEASDGDSIMEAENAHALQDLYHPISTFLSNMARLDRAIILSGLLLLLLSQGQYSAHSRVLMLHLTSSLYLPLTALTNEETEVAQTLLHAAKEMSGDEELQKRAEENKVARRWKVGIASVAGAALVGITGGLAAPVVASGIGALMGGVGLGGVASFIGIFAMNGALVGSLFGAYGASMTGEMVDAYAKEVEDFKFLPIKGEWDIASKEDTESRRLRVTLGISGWLGDKDDVTKPWRVLGEESEVFALRYETDTLLELGNSLKSIVSSTAWSYVKFDILKRTVLATLGAALWPVYLLSMATAVDSPFGRARSRSDKAGKVLADALINRAQGQRPITLVAYSLGSRVVYSCLLSLANRRAFGLVESVVLIGSPVPSAKDEWCKMKSVVSGKIINVFSENDCILAFLYRTSSLQYGVAGLAKVDNVEGVDNFDLSAEISGHLRYPELIGNILKQIGFIGVKVENKDIERDDGMIQLLDMEEHDHAEGADAEAGIDDARYDGDLHETEPMTIAMLDEQKCLIDFAQNDKTLK
jgi:pimeloyl-ACP methyl ester carboxylesterase